MVHSRNRVTLGVLGILIVTAECGVKNSVPWVLHSDGPVRSRIGARAVAVSPRTLSVVVCPIELSADGVSDARCMELNYHLHGLTRSQQAGLRVVCVVRVCWDRETMAR